MAKRKQRPTDLIAQDIQATRDSVASMQRRMLDIEQEIAQNWDSDTANLETEYGQLTARCRAAERRIEHLEAEQVESERAEQIDAYADARKLVVATWKTQKKSEAAIEKAREEVKRLEDAHRLDVGKYSRAAERQRLIHERLVKLKVDPEIIGQIDLKHPVE